MEINCQSVDAKTVKSGVLTLPSLPSPDGVYSLKSTANILTLSSALSYFQGSSTGPYNVGPVPGTTPLELHSYNQVGGYSYNEALYQLTIIEAGTYELTLSTVCNNNTFGPNKIDTGFSVAGVNSHEQSMNQAVNQESMVVNSLIITVGANTVVYPYAAALLTQLLSSTTFIAKKLG